MDADYPAAHSMDTTWFAVDDDGHVAQLDSRESGAVAEAADRDAEEAVIRALVRDRVPTVETHDLAGQRRVWGSAHGWSLHQAHSPMLLFLRSVEPVRAEIERGAALVFPATEGFAVLFPRLDEEVARRAHRGSSCRGCFPMRDDILDTADRRPARLGLFFYEHHVNNGEPGPYYRVAIPDTPLVLAEIPAAIRDRIAAVRFRGVCFAREVSVQPIEHVPSYSYGDSAVGYLGSDGYHRPMPGREEEFVALYGDPPDWPAR